MRQNLHIAFVLVNLWANVQTALSYICMVIQRVSGAGSRSEFLLRRQWTTQMSLKVFVCLTGCLVFFPIFFRLIILFFFLSPPQCRSVLSYYVFTWYKWSGCSCLRESVRTPWGRCVSGSDSDIFCNWTTPELHKLFATRCRQSDWQDATVQKGSRGLSWNGQKV